MQRKELRLERSVETEGLRSHIKDFISWGRAKSQRGALSSGVT